MSTFGDFDSDDAFATEPPDDEQVAIRLHRLRVEVDALVGPIGQPTWDELTTAEQELAIAIGHDLVRWLLNHRPDAEGAARSLHNVRRYLATTPLPAWDDLSDDERRIGIDLMQLIIDWLERQGAIV